MVDEAGARARLGAQVPPAEVQELQEQLEELAEWKDEAIRDQDFERAAYLRDREKEIQEEIKRRRDEWERQQEEFRPTLVEDDIAFIVGRWTGIPVTRLQEAETERLLRMEEELHKSIVGQHEAIQAVSRAIRRSRAGLKDPNRPIGSFIFCGPTGVGKTELARQLARFLFVDEGALVRVDMSEYMEKHSVSPSLIGSPPGYVGSRGGRDSSPNAVKRNRPYCVVLLDEIEKAHPDVFNILLQVLDEGRLTDNYGRVIDFKNTVLIMTSNVGTRDLASGSTLGFETDDAGLNYDRIKERVTQEVDRVFSPEFLNRVEDVIVFHPLDRKQIGEIVHILMRDVQDRLSEEELKIQLTDEAVLFIVEHGYDDKYGARPLKRTIQRYIEDSLSERILMAEFAPGDEIVVDVSDDDEDSLAFQVASPSSAT